MIKDTSKVKTIEETLDFIEERVKIARTLMANAKTDKQTEYARGYRMALHDLEYFINDRINKIVHKSLMPGLQKVWSVKDERN